MDLTDDHTVARDIMFAMVVYFWVAGGGARPYVI